MTEQAKLLAAIRAAPTETRGYVLNEALRSNVAVSFSDLLTDLAPFIEAERDAERKAWARLVKAEEQMGHGPTCGDGLRACRDEYEAAKQALRDLGVPVDELLEES